MCHRAVFIRCTKHSTRGRESTGISSFGKLCSCVCISFLGGWMTAWVSSPWYLKTPLNIYSFSFPLDAYLWWACFALTIDMTEKLSAASVDLYAHPSYEYLWELKRPRRLIILLFRLTLVISVHSIAKLDVLVLAVLPDAFLANGNSSFINC